MGVIIKCSASNCKYNNDDGRCMNDTISLKFHYSDSPMCDDYFPEYTFKCRECGHIYNNISMCCAECPECGEYGERI